MSYKEITIYTPPGTTPHIAAEDDAFIHHSLMRGKSGILGSLVCTKQDNTTVRLSGGGVSSKGYVMYIPDGDYCDLSVANGSQGMMRHDLVVAQFTKGGGDVADEHTFAVVQGTPSTAPTDPSLTTSALTASGDVYQTALFRIVINGLEIQSVEQVGVGAAEVTDAASAAVCSGNAASATKLATARTISLAGDVTGSVSFNGTANATITASVKKVKGKNIFIQSSTPTGAASGDLWFW